MPQNVFKQSSDVNNHPKRNNFDMSFMSHVTMKMGTLYPVFCKEVVPGDSFSINTGFRLKMLPLVFPIQSRMRAHIHYFYVRNKNLWNHWQDWISGLLPADSHPHPYIEPKHEDVKNGSIYDYLNVPTSIVMQDSVQLTDSLIVSDVFRNNVYALQNNGLDSNLSRVNSSNYTNKVHGVSLLFSVPLSTVIDNVVFSDGLVAYFDRINQTGFTETYYQVFADVDFNESSFTSIFNGNATYSKAEHKFSFSFSESEVNQINELIGAGSKVYICATFYNSSGTFMVPGFSLSGGTTDQAQEALFGKYLTSYDSPGFVDYSDSSLTCYQDGTIMLNALPFRAYESIYNAFYRNTQNDPFIKDGEKVYNDYITTSADGKDVTPYHLFQRNYELDFLTSALPSPQQGVAPLVGMSALGDITIEDENGITTAKAELDDDGTITKVTLTSPLASVDHARTAMNIASVGMSINDFRNVNAFQRWLETNIRKGYKYVDFIAGHFGKSPNYSVMDMPEFIGGYSRDVNISTIVSQADTLGMLSETRGAGLGDFAGFGSLEAVSNHPVRHYCDDYGFIMGILCVTPEPAYSQLLPKHFLKSRPLDYYFPEFSQLGMQPITYREVLPLQRLVDSEFDSSLSLNDTFGYQRPNYDLVSSVDEVHGEFRGTMRNMVINRLFSHSPQLGHDFLAINPDEVNDIFAYTDPEDDTIIGHLVFQVHSKRPIPRVVIPNLGK